MPMRLHAALAVAAAIAFSACGGNGEPAALITPSPAASATPTREAPPLPDKPADFGDLPAAIAQYLTDGGGSADCLQALLEAWEMPADGTTHCATADLDGDGRDEYVVRIAREAEAPASQNGLEGTVAVFDEDGGAYAAAFRLEDLKDGSQPVFPMEKDRVPDPAIVGVQDVDENGTEEAALTSTQCGAHTCHVTLCLVASSAGAYASLIESPAGASCISAPSAEDQVRFEDADGDGVSDLLFREGLTGSVGAGPQRESLHTYRWNGERYALAGTEYESSNLRYFKARDADDALAGGDYETAIKLYREAANSPDLVEAEFGEPTELRSYARFRIGLALAQKGDSAAALTALDEAIAAEPDALHSQLAARFRQGYAKVKHVSPGCAAARDFVQANLAAFAALWDYGYANPEFDPDALCPF